MGDCGGTKRDCDCHSSKTPEAVDVEGYKELGGKIHKILNETVYRKLTLKEYRKLTRLIGNVFTKAQSSLTALTATRKETKKPR